MRFLVLADIHGHESGLKALLAATTARDGIIVAGDVTQRGDAQQADDLIRLLATGQGRLLGVPGNMDDPGLAEVFAAKAVSLHGAGCLIEGTGFFGVGGSNPTPFHSPFEIPEEEIGRLLRQGYGQVARARRKILVSHVPPAGSTLDRTFLGAHAGSVSVRRFLEEREVDFCLCGHIHEAAGEETIAGVPCVNVGPAQKGHYAWLEIENDTITMTRRKIRTWT
jgi:hypothetical protein